MSFDDSFDSGSGGYAPQPPATGGFPGNELEEVLAASLGIPEATPRLLEVVGRSSLWVPLPEGGGPDSATLSLPTTEIGGAPYVPVFSSQEEFLRVVGGHMSFTVAPAREFARGLPPQLGIAVNPGGTVGVPLPPEAVAELCRDRASSRLPGEPSGGRVRLFTPDWQEEPVHFLAAVRREFERVPVVRTARRGLASVEARPAQLYVGVELDAGQPSWQEWEPPPEESRGAVAEALGRALGVQPVPWEVQLVFLDAADDPVITWMRGRVEPFYIRAG